MDARIHYCQPGYALSSPKTFLIAFGENASFAEVKFKILDASSKCVFEGAAKKICRCDYTGEFLFRGDFSAVTAPGQYRIVLEDFNVTSHVFDISNEWLARETKANIKSFYYQRSGVELPAKFKVDEVDFPRM